MTVKLLEATGGRFVMRRPDGSTLFDTAERAPAELQRFQVAGLTVDWPVAPGETNVWLPLQGRYRHEIPAHLLYSTQVLGTISPAGLTPQFYLSSIKMTQTLRGTVAGAGLYCRQPQSIWIGMVGSLQIESFNEYIFRAINIAAVGGNIVLEKRQVGFGGDDDFNIPCSTQSTYTMDFDIACGIFDG